MSMYRDSQHDLTIELSGPDGNFYNLLGVALRLGSQLNMDPNTIEQRMKAGDYNDALAYFKETFPVVRLQLYGKPLSA